MSAVLDRPVAAPASTIGHHQWIPLTKLAASPLNHRKIFKKEKMEELAASIRAQGIISPILARPLPDDKFEVVAGERRFRAAKMAQLVDVPAVVRELTDAQALELQVIENGQREDPHPLEEAEGYEALLKCTHPNGEKYTVDEIAAKVGKSRSFVFARLKLLALCPEARKAFYEDLLDASRALLIARIGHHDTQREALKDITGGRFHGEPMSYREAHQHILSTYTLQLKSAVFDIKDANLVPKAGACGPCPKRTGNQADLFGDVKSADVCTDPKCFDDKRQAHYAVAARELEAKGKKVIYGAGAKKLLPGWNSESSWDRNRLQGGYVRMDETTYAAGSARKVKDILGEGFEPTLIQHPGTGEILKVATQQAVTAAVSKASPAKRGSSGTRRSSTPRERELSPQEVFNQRLLAELFKKLPTVLGKAELTVIAEDMLAMSEGTDLVANLLYPLKDGKKHPQYQEHKAIEAMVPKLDVARLSQLVMALLLARDCTDCYGSQKPKLMLDAARRWKVDPDKVKKAIVDEKKADEDKSAKPAKNSKGLAALGIKAKKAKPAQRAPAKAKRVAEFMKPMKPSAALAAIVGDKPMPRTEVTSKLWGYIKKHDLQDKVNRRMINPDGQLGAVFGTTKPVSMFQMTKIMRKHLS